MRVGILGSGDVGRTLGRGFLGLGHEVLVGTGSPHSEKMQVWLRANASESAGAGTFSEAAEHGELLVLATKWSGTESILAAAGAEHFAAKTVIDATNPLVFEEGKPPHLGLAGDDSGGEQVQRWLLRAKVVKAFNSVGHALMVHPDLPGGPPTMFVAGNHDDAKTDVVDICQLFGWEVVDAGDITASRYLEAMCMLWVEYGASTNSWHHAFKLLKK